MRRSYAEQETIVRFDRSSPMANYWTAAPTMANKWRRLGYLVTADGFGWRAEAPISAFTFRRLRQKAQDAAEEPIFALSARVKSKERQ
jgi:hypothetical protein